VQKIVGFARVVKVVSWILELELEIEILDYIKVII